MSSPFLVAGLFYYDIFIINRQKLLKPLTTPHEYHFRDNPQCEVIHLTFVNSVMVLGKVELKEQVQ